MIVKDNAYLWRHPEEYERLTIDKLNDEAVLNAMEFALSGLKEEIDNIIEALKKHPYDKDNLINAIVMIHNLESKYFENITFGHNEELIEQIKAVLPKGVDLIELARKNEAMEEAKRQKRKKRVERYRCKRNITDDDRRRRGYAS